MSTPAQKAVDAREVKAVQTKPILEDTVSDKIASGAESPAARCGFDSARFRSLILGARRCLGSESAGVKLDFLRVMMLC